MTAFIAVRDLVTAQFNTDWAGRTPIAFDNRDFTPPENAAWVRFSVQHNFGSQVTLGNTGARVFRRLGLIFIQVFMILDDGLENSDTLAEAALSIFEGKQISGIWFRDGSIQEIGPDGVWFQVNVSLAFQYDEIK